MDGNGRVVDTYRYGWKHMDVIFFKGTHEGLGVLKFIDFDGLDDQDF